MKLLPLHTVAVIGVIAGLGFTVTVTVNGEAGQLPNEADDEGVTVYVAVCAVFVVLTRAPVILAGLPLLAAPPVITPVTIGAGQV